MIRAHEAARIVAARHGVPGERPPRGYADGRVNGAMVPRLAPPEACACRRSITSRDDLAAVIELVGDGHGHHIAGTPDVYRHWWIPLDGTELGDDGIRRPGKGAAGKPEPAAATAVRRAARGRTDARDTQSWSLSRVGRLKSGNTPGMTVAREYSEKEILGRYSPNDWERARRAGFAHPRDYQRDITEDIRRWGMINPVRTSRGALDEGYHRYAAMRQLRKRTMPAKKIY